MKGGSQEIADGGVVFVAIEAARAWFLRRERES